MPTLTHDGTTFIWQGDYTTKDIPKSVGFVWDRESQTWRSADPSAAVRLDAYADETARAAYAAVDTAIAASQATDAQDIVLPGPPGLAYRPYQRAGIAYRAQRKGTLIGDEMGLGKTIQALGISSRLQETRWRTGYARQRTLKRHRRKKTRPRQHAAS